jgi:hypothetical protein
MHHKQQNNNNSMNRLTKIAVVFAVFAGPTLHNLQAADPPTPLADKTCKQYNIGGGGMDPGCGVGIVTLLLPDGTPSGHKCPTKDCEEYTAPATCGTCSTAYQLACQQIALALGDVYATVTISHRTAACTALAAESGGHDCAILTCTLKTKGCFCPTQFPGTMSDQTITCDCGNSPPPIGD